MPPEDCKPDALTPFRTRYSEPAHRRPAEAGLLWFETAAELTRLREEAERLVVPGTP